MQKYFSECIDSKKNLNIITTNGFQIHCRIIEIHKDPDDHGPIKMIDVLTERKEINHIMIHAISTIVEI